MKSYSLFNRRLGGAAFSIISLFSLCLIPLHGRVALGDVSANDNPCWTCQDVCECGAKCICQNEDPYNATCKPDTTEVCSNYLDCVEYYSGPGPSNTHCP